jgi:hypothetical protein
MSRNPNKNPTYLLVSCKIRSYTIAVTEDDNVKCGLLFVSECLKQSWGTWAAMSAVLVASAATAIKALIYQVQYLAPSMIVGAHDMHRGLAQLRPKLSCKCHLNLEVPTVSFESRTKSLLQSTTIAQPANASTKGKNIRESRPLRSIRSSRCTVSVRKAGHCWGTLPRYAQSWPTSPAIPCSNLEILQNK